MQKAIMLHTPIVSTDTFSMRTIVPDDSCGYLLPMGDVEGLRSKLTVLLADEKIIKPLKHGKKLIKAKTPLMM